MMPSLFLALLFQLAAEPAPAQVPATTLRPDDLRVASVAYRLGRQGLAFCPETYPITGMQLHHLAEYDAPARAIEIERHALDRGPGVLATVANSPAAHAGIVAGDVLLAIEGMPFPDSRAMIERRDRAHWRSGIEAIEDRIEAALRRGAIDLMIMRAGRVVTVELRSVSGCPARVRLAQSNQANAFASGTHVVVATRLYAALASDDELAVIIGHELAHNILHHNERLKARDPSRLGVLASEEEADRLGLRLVFAAGYDVHAAIPMWRRLYDRFGGGGGLFGSHPSLKTRERLIAATIAELEAGRTN